jgi:hypothetical protein
MGDLPTGENLLITFDPSRIYSDLNLVFNL